jgi:hypothetical protein
MLLVCCLACTADQASGPAGLVGTTSGLVGTGSASVLAGLVGTGYGGPAMANKLRMSL